MSEKNSSRLMFKGEKKEKKKHKKRRRDERDTYGDTQGDSEPSEGWLNPPTQAHILGPLYMICVQPSYGNPIEAKPCALAIQPSPVSPIAKVVPAPLSAGALESLDPDDVNHVMVATRVIDSEEKVTLRTANGRYLAADQLGAVSAEQEARGPQEEWLLEPISQLAPIPDQPSGSAASPDPAQESSPDGLFALKSCLYNKYLTVEELANGKLDIRCDSDSPTDECSHILVRMQAVELVKAKKRLADERAKKGLSAKSNDSGLTILKPGQSFRDLEANNVRQYQARGAGRLELPAESKSALKKARKEGRLAEELLDRRSKIKSDRYAK
ncbi:hypothetical protein PCANC_13219 [Puccinia coronata f. sp. avenae]|uniref:Uncharacterized protein n=1 Tax=Puccinia coronata f. sp. avenae TaxID=200324 RepID=A0A2N5V038_9BASI|nr:hypothetical protein PCASD_25289 [Puccinia coronata f. sp. avenae]PLW43368.1 hypothetical protein PCANC_13219 [Puccinia coronata f. sp. avenae]PLW45558.1 hypothetical protein PCASD_06236 [Puccinia coronata f. sp. avenae]